MTVEEIADFILPWADEHMADAAAKTRLQAKYEPAYRRFLGRLIVRRHEKQRDVPLRFLEQTDLVVILRSKRNGKEVKVSAALAPKPRAVSFLMVEQMYQTLDNAEQMWELVETLSDLEFEVEEDSQRRKLSAFKAPPPAPVAPKVAPPASVAADPTVVLELLPPMMRGRDD